MSRVNTSQHEYSLTFIVCTCQSRDIVLVGSEGTTPGKDSAQDGETSMIDLFRRPLTWGWRAVHMLL
jgi:hypothetical protein